MNEEYFKVEDYLRHLDSLKEFKELYRLDKLAERLVKEEQIVFPFVSTYLFYDPSKGSFTLGNTLYDLNSKTMPFFEIDSANSVVELAEKIEEGLDNRIKHLHVGLLYRIDKDIEELTKLKEKYTR